MNYSKKSFGLTKGLVIVVVVGFIVIFGWSMWSAGRLATNANPKTVSQPMSRMTIDQLFVSIKQKAASQYSGVTPEGARENPNGLHLQYSADGYPYKVDVGSDASYIFFKKFQGPKQAGAQQLDLPPALKDLIRNQIISDGYKVVSKPPVDISSQTGSKQRNAWYYARSDAVCFFATSSLAYLSCAPTTTFQKDAKDVAPFASAISQVANVPQSNLVLFKPDIKTTADSLYRSAAVGYMADIGSGAYSFFYQKATDDTWHYYRTSQEGILCAGISNPDAAAAFAPICSNPPAHP